jgi:hypothetical protein
MVHALGDQRDARHEAERLDEVGELVLAVQLAAVQRPSGAPVNRVATSPASSLGFAMAALYLDGGRATRQHLRLR